MSARSDKEGNSTLSTVFFVLGGLSLLGGIVLCIALWPKYSGYGYEWNTVAYLPSILWFSAGFVECAVFTAIGKILTYLKLISFNTENSNA